MRTRKYKTLKGLLSQAVQLNLNNLIGGWFIHKKLGYVKFQLPKDEMHNAFEQLASVIYRNGKKMCYRLENYRGRSHGIFERLAFFDGEASYCAGQDYDGEIKCIQSLLKRNV